MNTVFEICIFVILAGIPLQLFYWCVIRPVCLARLRFELCRASESLQAYSSTAKEGKQALQVLHGKCDNALICLNHVDVLVALAADIPKETRLRLDRDREVISDSPQELRKIHRNIEGLLAAAAVLNSPGFVVLCMILLPIVVLVVLCFVVINRAKNLLDAFARRLWACIYLPEKTATC